MSVTRRITGLLEIAAEDAAGAATLARTKNRNSAYLCQQAAEKLIKAVLLAQGIESGAEHHLDVLVAKLPDDHHWKSRLRTLDSIHRTRPRTDIPARGDGSPLPRTPSKSRRMQP